MMDSLLWVYVVNNVCLMLVSLLSLLAGIALSPVLMSMARKDFGLSVVIMWVHLHSLILMVMV